MKEQPQMPRQSTAEADRLLTRAEAAAFLGLRMSALEKDVCEGGIGLPYIKLGRRIRYRRTSLERWLAEREAIPPGGGRT
jgi:excisionase family DNA binding protein